MLLNEEDLDRFWERHFRHRAFRLNARQRYDGESAEAARYLAGDASPDPAGLEAWLDELRRDTAAGKQWQFVQVFTGQATDWFRYACQWSYPANITAGAQVRILDRTLGDIDTLSAPRPDDFWLLDEDAALDMIYDEQDRFIGAEVVPLGVTPRYGEFRDWAWEAAVPLADWWDAHPEYRRKAAAA